MSDQPQDLVPEDERVDEAEVPREVLPDEDRAVEEDVADADRLVPDPERPVHEGEGPEEA